MRSFKLKKLKNQFKIKLFSKIAGNDSKKLDLELDQVVKKLIKSLNINKN